ncbi:L-fucose mutarotase [Pseudalgibacter alginicilyticus]|uniref:L-fucose mutarotase n=1 Tax=Pseudalgibacter alginicilyticus TaxID=1736674 RepID=A0A0P0CF88_9FLAO|nr:L-rhamnose mutarotase [Pseudalgibacter alginicilyticus]ALJ04690.1 L-fucose mutarotase [Pseudalgibacter alginicilyticus]
MKDLKRYCLALDLVDDPVSIAEYKKHHEKVWTEITESIKKSGIENAEIYCVGNRLFMILEVNDSFSFEKKNKMDLSNPKVQEWENLMWNYQQALPIAKKGEKWLLMDKVFEL